MSQVERTRETKSQADDAEIRAWLQEQLERYSDLLTYLREH